VNLVLVLNETNFKEWKENMKIAFGRMNLDLALRIDKPHSLKFSSISKEEKI